MQELPKPWFDLQTYKKTRLLEAKYEAEIARKFLDEGLIRNAAGKVYQAWKALVAGIAVDYRDKLRNLFTGKVKIRGGKAVEKVDWVIAIMPSTALKTVSQVIGGEISLYTNVALLIHQYQYNGPDKEGILSPYTNDEVAKNDIILLLNEIEKILSSY
ncbi:PaREP1 family protein [Stygiolobus sp. CP850M]|uniref:PaREP1 family protein n=1 Tax=Stygiolobus sp. CP850M TaxID=3133134 RepID=UPI00307DD64C